jgi:hypothetical protein
MHHTNTLSMILTAALATTAPLGAQGHTVHRHPSGAKIIMTGILVEPLCQFAQKLTGSRLQDCVQRLSDGQFRPVLLNPDDSALYVLHSPSDREIGTAQMRRLVGQSVKVDGTVFPAGNTYLIVVDSLRSNTP